MAAHTTTTTPAERLDLSKYRSLPMIFMAVGGLGAVAGLFLNQKQFAYSWLLAFMFFLSIMVGGWFLTMVHHLFDAGWSFPFRRINEHLACLAPVMALLFLPIAFLAKKHLYDWMDNDPHSDHALGAKLPLFTSAGFYIIAIVNFVLWSFFSFSLRRWSLVQDQTGEARATFKLRFLSCLGIICFAFTVTLAAIMWMKALQHQWFSTMYGVYYFAGSVWTTLATVYVLALVLRRTGHLAPVLKDKQFYFLGSLFFAFTVFYAYIHFSQYFIIWNANMPEETFWYVLREKGTWFQIGMIIIFGHFFLPFLSLLRIDAKLTPWLMIALWAWAWLMHFLDMSFNIMPLLHPNGFVLHWIDIACWLFMLGVVITVFLRYFNAHPPYPLRDPRMAEGLDVVLAGYNRGEEQTLGTQKGLH